ncbi:MAG: FAD-dependent oxidoreductase [Planctomyces sp.]
MNRTSRRPFLIPLTRILGALLAICFLSPAARSTDADVIVVGGSPGGIAAAIAAARNGSTVILVEYHSHLGGMMTSGLGKSDVENRAMIGGLFQEFTVRVRKHYEQTWGPDHENVQLCRDGYYYEPSVAEKIIEEMIQEHSSIAVLKGWRLEGAETTDHRLRSIEVVQHSTGERQTLRGQVFVDATYEGDLFAAAGAAFRIGRESRKEFQEAHAGVVYFDYQERKFLDGTTGDADDRLPAYTYRLCLTTDPANSVALTSPPPDYDRSNYLGYFDDLKAGRLAGPKTVKPGRGYNPVHFNTMVRALSVTPLPNGKTDVNINPRPLGFPFVEENRGYIEGDDNVRRKICERHRNLTLGLLWFLQNDAEVPEPHRKLARELHLPKDEFVDNNHFPFQLYVREGRRLKGLYTLTENDITGAGDNRTPRQFHDSIAVGEFPIDSFPCRRRQPSDTIVLEGYLGMLDSITRPYEIPFRIMLPESVDGLVVPVAASTTHVAYSSIRMEPTWMALGQAAGTAAALAVERNQPLRELPIGVLQASLVLQKQVIHHPETEPKSDAELSGHQEADPRLMLSGGWLPADTRDIDFAGLPKISSDHIVVSDVRSGQTDPSQVNKTSGGVNQHNYLIHHAGRYFLMWSDGPGVEDRVGQRVKFATSADGVNWNKGEYLSPEPPGSGPDSEFYGTRTDKGFRWIARGFWKRGEELLALASLDEAAEFFGPALQLNAFRFEEQTGKWQDLGVISKNTINNFPPEKTPDGKWMMSRRMFDYKKTGVHFLVGGVNAIDDWESFPVNGSESELAAEEPFWWTLQDGRLMALFRDNRHSGFLYRSFSEDNGRNWTVPVQTNFPDATSKMHGIRLTDGRYVLVSNPNPKKRDPLALAVSTDGVTFQQMGYLVGDRRVDYPHVMEHNGFLFVAFSGAKQTVELLRIRLTDLSGSLQ